MYVDIPELVKMSDEEKALATQRALKELTANINRELEAINTKIEKIRKTVEGLK